MTMIPITLLVNGELHVLGPLEAPQRDGCHWRRSRGPRPERRLGGQEGLTVDARPAAGADGLIVEVHPEPDKALSDGGQSLKPERFAEMVQQVRAVAEAVGKKLAPVR